MEGLICICIYTYLSKTVPLKFSLIKTMFSDVDKDKFEDGVKITLYLSRLSCAQDLRFFLWISRCTDLLFTICTIDICWNLKNYPFSSISSNVYQLQFVPKSVPICSFIPCSIEWCKGTDHWILRFAPLVENLSKNTEKGFWSTLCIKMHLRRKLEQRKILRLFLLISKLSLFPQVVLNLFNKY